MVTRMEVKEVNVLEDQLQLLVADLLDAKETESLIDGQRMLVDSEQVAFIYLLEKGDAFVHLSLGKSIWSNIKLALERTLPVIVSVGEKKTIELTQFQTELEYLLENIKGNCNYGNKMVESVEEVFNLEK